MPDITYVLSGTNSEDFSVQKSNNDVGNLIVARNLDFEARQSYQLFLTTTDGQSSNLPDTRVNVFINILVSKDACHKKFHKYSYQITPY